jgi:putative transposase
VINHKRVYRLYKQEQLALRRKNPRRRASCRSREGRPPVEAANQVWAMDFVTVPLADGRKARVLTVLDLFTREALAIRADARFTSGQVIAVLEELTYLRGAPGSVRVDNGPEFTGKRLDLWAYFNKVTLDFSRPGKPTDNAFIESFNGRPRQKCLDPSWFVCLDDLRQKTEAWRKDTTRSVHTAPWGTWPPRNSLSHGPGSKGRTGRKNSHNRWSKHGERLNFDPTLTATGP